MTIDEAIAHAKEKAKRYKILADSDNLVQQSYGAEFDKYKYEKCAKEHEQLAEWLEELKDLREKAECARCVYNCGCIDEIAYKEGYNKAIDEAYMKAKTLMDELQCLNSGRSNGKTHRLYCIQALEFLRQVAEQLRKGVEE